MSWRAGRGGERPRLAPEGRGAGRGPATGRRAGFLEDGRGEARHGPERRGLEGRLAEWRRLLRASTTQGRTVLQRILRGRLTFTPRTNPISGEVDGYDFSGPTRFDKLFTGIAVATPPWVQNDGKGCEGIGPEDTFDADYGRLLDRVRVKGVGVPRRIRTPVDG